MFTIVSLVFAIGFSLFLLSGAVAAIRLRAHSQPHHCLSSASVRYHLSRLDCI